MNNDTLRSKFPEIVEKYWDYSRNLGVKPEDFSPMSNKKVWWKCSVCGGSWKTEISSVTRGRGCPYCSGRKVLPGFNDLATKRPELLNEWDYEKNSFSPAEVQVFSMKEACQD